MGAGYGFLVFRKLKDITSIRIGKFYDLLKRMINFIINLIGIEVNKLAGNRRNGMPEFESILQFFFCPFACTDIRDNAENRLFTIIVNELGGNDGFNFLALFVEEGILIGSTSSPVMWRFRLDLIKSTDSGAIRVIKSKFGA